MPEISAYKSAMSLNEIQCAAAAQFNRQSDRYGSQHILSQTDDILEALRRFDLPAHADVLDVATGGGHTALALARFGHAVVVTDLAEAMVAKAITLLREEGFATTGYVCPAEALAVPDGSFDLVTCRVAPHHFSDVPGFVREVARVLRAGGWFLLIDGSVSCQEPESEAWLHRVEKLRDPSHHRLLNDREWKQVVQEAGLALHHEAMSPLQQPDLEWYFETANTSPENRQAVLREVAEASEEVRDYLRIETIEGRIIWWWPRLTLLARK